MEYSSTFRSSWVRLGTIQTAKTSLWFEATSTAHTMRTSSPNSATMNSTVIKNSFHSGRQIVREAAESKSVKLTRSYWSTGIRRGSDRPTIRSPSLSFSSKCPTTRWRGTTKGTERFTLVGRLLNTERLYTGELGKKLTISCKDDIKFISDKRSNFPLQSHDN